MLTSTVSPFARASSNFAREDCGGPPVRFDSWVRGDDRVGVFVPFLTFFLASFCGVDCGVDSSPSVFCGGGAVPLDDAPSFTLAGVAGEAAVALLCRRLKRDHTCDTLRRQFREGWRRREGGGKVTYTWVCSFTRRSRLSACRSCNFSVFW